MQERETMKEKETYNVNVAHKRERGGANGNQGKTREAAGYKKRKQSLFSEQEVDHS